MYPLFLEQVWVLSYTDESREQILECLRNSDISQFIKIKVGSISAESTISPDMILTESNLSATILILEKAGLEDLQYLQSIRNMCRLVSSREDFRFYVWFNDMSFRIFQLLFEYNSSKNPDEAIKKIIDTGQMTESEALRLLSNKESMEVLSDLRDTVQISENTDPAAICSDLRNYLLTLRDIRDQAKYRKLRIKTAKATRLAALTVQLCCLLIVTAAALMVLFFGFDAFSSLPAEYRIVMAMISGVLYFPAISVIIYLLSRYGLAILGHPKSCIVVVVVCLMLTVPLWMIDGILAPWEWFILGILAGTIIDLSRRNGQSVRRILQKPDSSKSTQPGHSLPRHIRKIIDGMPINPLNCPIFPDQRQYVFISYTHSSQWSSDVADLLVSELKDRYVNHFLDRNVIETGSSWRNTLNEKIGKSLAFISIVEENTISRPWPAAEMEAALEGKSLTGSPAIIVIVDEKLSYSPSDKIFPVFQSILHLSSEAITEDQPRVIRVKRSIADQVPGSRRKELSTLVSGLRSTTFSSHAVLEDQLAALISLIMLPLTTILHLIGTMGTFIGIGALILLFIEGYHIFSLSLTLKSFGLLGIGLIACGFWMGYTVRLILASRFEIRRQNAMQMTLINIIALAGFFWYTVLWLQFADGFVMSCGAVAIGIGWLLASNFLYYARLGQDKDEVQLFTEF